MEGIPLENPLCLAAWLRSTVPVFPGRQRLYRYCFSTVHFNRLKFPSCHGQRIGPAVYTLTRPPYNAWLQPFLLKCFAPLCSRAMPLFPAVNILSCCHGSPDEHPVSACTAGLSPLFMRGCILGVARSADLRAANYFGTAGFEPASGLPRPTCSLLYH